MKHWLGELRVQGKKCPQKDERYGQQRTPPRSRSRSYGPAVGMALRVRALESLLVEKGLVDPAAMTRLLDLRNRIVPRNGAKVVARA